MRSPTAASSFNELLFSLSITSNFPLNLGVTFFAKRVTYTNVIPTCVRSFSFFCYAMPERMWNLSSWCYLTWYVQLILNHVLIMLIHACMYLLFLTTNYFYNVTWDNHDSVKPHMISVVLTKWESAVENNNKNYTIHIILVAESHSNIKHNFLSRVR